MVGSEREAEKGVKEAKKGDNSTGQCWSPNTGTGFAEGKAGLLELLSIPHFSLSC